jgi:hypothetical protein
MGELLLLHHSLISLLLESRSSKGKGSHEPLTVSMSFWSPPEGIGRVVSVEVH